MDPLYYWGASVQAFVVAVTILALGFALVTLFLILGAGVAGTVPPGLAGGFLAGAILPETVEVDGFAP